MSEPIRSIKEIIMKTIQISNESYNNIQKIRKSFADGNLLFPKVIFSDEDIIDILTLHYNRLFIQISASIGIELKDENNKKENWIQTKEGLKKRKKFNDMNTIDITKVS